MSISRPATAQCLSFIDNYVDAWSKIGFDDSVGRSGHSTVVCRETAFSYGGVKGRDLGEVCGELRVFSLTSNLITENTWKHVETTGENPGCRASHAMCFDEDASQIYFVGGIDKQRHVCAQMHVLNCQEMVWKRLHFQSSDAFRAIGVYGQTLLYFQGSLYSFGGCDQNSRYYQGAFKFHIQECEWSLLKTKGSPPSVRNRHAAFIHLDANEEHVHSMYIIGGGAYRPKEDKIDAYKLNIHTLVWKKVKTCGRNPGGRFAFGSAYDAISESFFLYGGHTKWLHRLGDLYCLDIGQGYWMEIKTEDGPGARAFHSCFAHERVLFIFGGTDGVARIDDTWMLSLKDVKDYKENVIVTSAVSP